MTRASGDGGGGGGGGDALLDTAAAIPPPRTTPAVKTAVCTMTALGMSFQSLGEVGRDLSRCAE